MKTTDLFTNNRSAKRLNESLAKTFGQKLNLESFSIEQLEDARNKLRTQIYTARSGSNFNETVENETLSKAQFMHDAIVAELMDRNEPIVDTTQFEASDSLEDEVAQGEDDNDKDERGTFDQGESVQNEAYINNAEDAINLLADIRKQSKMAERGAGEPVRPNQLVNDLWDVMQWIEANMKESFETESAPPTAKGERMVKHIKKGYADDGKLTDKEKSIAYATAWKAHNKNESIDTTGEDMRNLREGEIQQASAIVTAKTMVDRVGRWIEELSGMENDTLLQLGDSIRDEMGQEQAKAFIQAVAPAIQQALDTLKGTRDTLSTGVRSLASGEQPTDMLGAEPGADMAAPAEPDAMNPAADDMTGEPEGDDFDAAEPAAGGLGDAGREQRESIDRQGRLLKVLAG
jgi:hypothetical protein